MGKCADKLLTIFIKQNKDKSSAQEVKSGKSVGTATQWCSSTIISSWIARGEATAALTLREVRHTMSKYL